MFTVLFAMGRLPGWIAHWLEMHQNPSHENLPPAPDLRWRAETRVRADGKAEVIWEGCRIGDAGAGPECLSLSPASCILHPYFKSSMCVSECVIHTPSSSYVMLVALFIAAATSRNC